MLSELLLLCGLQVTANRAVDPYMTCTHAEVMLPEFRLLCGDLNSEPSGLMSL